MSDNLNDLVQQKKKIEEEIIASEGELSEETELMLSQADALIKGKVDNFGVFLKEVIPNHIKACKEQIKRLQLMEQRLENFAEYVLNRTDGKKLSGYAYKMSLRKSPPSVIIENEWLIPPEYWVEKPVEKMVDKNKLKEAVLNGLKVPGVKVEFGEHLRIEAGKAEPKQIKS